MLKKSTLLFVSIFVLLFIGLSDYGYGCHRKVDGDPVPHGPKDDCNDGGSGSGSGGGEAGEYIVTISNGGVAAITVDPWLGHQGEKVIVINNGRQYGDLPVFTDLGFFRNDANVDGGGTCFKSGVEFLGQLGVLKGGGAVAQFWFDGFQKFLVDGLKIPASYHLRMFGQFTLGVPPVRPPIGEVEMFIMEMEDWELNVQGGNNIQAVSCMGESDPSGDPEVPRFNPPVVITVERCPNDFAGLCPP